MFVRSRKRATKDGSVSISFQILESYWNAEHKRSIHRVIKNLGTCKIYKYEAKRMTQGEYYRMVARKYKVFLDTIKSELQDFPKGVFLYAKIKIIIRRNDNYYTRHF